MGKLSATGVRAATRTDLLGDGDGLFLVVGKTGSKSWIVRVQKHGRRRDIGVGSAFKVPLSKARERARQIREWVEDGLDPVFEKRKAAGIPTFKEASKKVVDLHRKTWRNEKHEAQWLRTLEMFVWPTLGDIRVSEITGPMVRNVLAEIWLTKPETARRVRQRIGAVRLGIRFRISRNRSSDEVDYQGASKATEEGRQPLRRNAVRRNRRLHEPAERARELQSAGLTVRNPNRGQIGRSPRRSLGGGRLRSDALDDPPERMKANREHVVPLSAPALRVLRRCRQLRADDEPLIFPGIRGCQPMSDMTLTKTEAAYRRGNLLEKRRSLMRDWAFFCLGTATKTSLRTRVAAG